ncbi:hypothetical protein D8I24_0289 (plasmid) [Cupriavidus necator H850]|uniref:hypothetical protein n=1 Tax=Cupriavidus necator TaxID=106590 RepID=UPI00129E3C42|nr:hypothetical protein [Cupriavidus necator]KAI3611140.1 hypothetical protein D8I24_0289 [Cupriavidus necator H850]
MTANTTIFLEAHYFGDDYEELRLPCDAIATTAGGLVVAGVETRHLREELQPILSVSEQAKT